MQIRKFEAPTIQEAIETMKRALGPEAIILQTKRNRGTFGLMSKRSVEVTAAVSEKSLQKKSLLDRRLSDEQKEALATLPVEKQREHYDGNFEKQRARATKGITATRYIDIGEPPGARAPE